ncbi:CsgG/HfaB family protein [Foetidibacter luteolus]|uniref:CsgG/HfaB family protein n=1 Tax=Foetidibacter luteolus TaxID=2608880 RepID=UPI00129A7B2C|nr:CsgG/HfaB family protein [Foetidibacter luteolus]
MRKPFCLFCICLFAAGTLLAQSVKIEEIQQQCTGLPYNKRVRISVSNFTVATPKARGQFGDELAQMLTNALQNVNCFNVLLSVKDSKELTDEISFGQAGNTAAGAAPATGKMKGPQVIVMGKVTEYAEGEQSGGALGFKVGGKKAHIGFIVQLINAETREIIESKSIDVDGRANGFKGVKLFGLQMAGSIANKALADACEKGIIQAVEFIAGNKDNMPLPEGNSGVAEVKKYSASNCPVLAASYVPKIMVILPEFHITQRIPDPAGETEINRKFIEAGFPVVDPAMFATIKNSARFDQAAKNPAAAISLGKEFGADVVIYGEAFSQRVGVQNGTQVSCRARVEIRAVRTDDATMIATNGLEAGALDLAEFVAAKSALRSAATLVGDYMLEQFCSRQLTFNKAGSSKGATVAKTASAGKNVTEINVTNVDYGKLKALSDALAAKGKVLDKSLSNGSGVIKFEHSGSLDTIADFIDSKLGAKFSIQDVGGGKITLAGK